MEEYEGWDPHPTRKNIFIDQETRLLYKRSVVGSFHRIPQKMTDFQENECFRKADGVVRMTSRSRGKVSPPADKNLAKESE